MVQQEARRQLTPAPVLPIALAILLFFSLAFGKPAFSQVRPPGMTDSERNQIYREISQETQVLSKQISLLKKIVKVVRPTVVHIEINAGGSRRNRQPDETGSGVIFKRGDKFFVLSNRHLVRYADADELTIRLSDGRELRPTSIRVDAGTDIAVLELDRDRLTAARIGDSAQLEIGDYILAIGSPFGLNHSVTHGIVSAKGRRDLELAPDGVTYQDFLQIDASINPGNSGGPLVNLKGEVVGVNTAIASTSGRNEGVGFAIPINMAMDVAEQLIEKGNVARGFLGVSLDSRFNYDAAVRLGLETARGAKVTGITANSAAARARVRAGDVILRFNGTWIDSDAHLVNQVSMTPVGNPVPMLVFRDGQLVELTVTVGLLEDSVR